MLTKPPVRFPILHNLQLHEDSFLALLPSVASIESIEMPRPRLMDRLRLRRSLSSVFARFLPGEEQSCDVISDIPPIS